MVRSQAPTSEAAGHTISGLAKAGGVGVETVRYYQRRGLLETPGRPAGDGQGVVRRYGSEHVRKLRFIRSAQAAGFTLEQIQELLALDATDDRARARQLARERIAALDAKIAELGAARSALAHLARACGAGGRGPCPILAAFDERCSAGTRRGAGARRGETQGGARGPAPAQRGRAPRGNVTVPDTPAWSPR